MKIKSKYLMSAVVAAASGLAMANADVEKNIADSKN